MEHMGYVFDTIYYPLVICYIAIENGPVEIVSFPIKHGGSFHSFCMFTRRYNCITSIFLWFPMKSSIFSLPSDAVRKTRQPKVLKVPKVPKVRRSDHLIPPCEGRWGGGSMEKSAIDGWFMMENPSVNG